MVNDITDTVTLECRLVIKRIDNMSQRHQVIQLYKTLLHLGKDYPQGYDFFRTRLKRAFMKNRDVEDVEKINKMIKHGEFVIKELEALYMLRKYRTLKKRYYSEPEDEGSRMKNGR